MRFRSIWITSVTLCLVGVSACERKTAPQSEQPVRKAEESSVSESNPESAPGGGALALTATTGAAPGYVGEDLCYSCHPGIAESYREVGMAKAFYKPSADNIIEDFDNSAFYHGMSDRYYEMTHEGDDFYVERYQTDADGERFNEHKQRIDYVIGSGHHSRGYVYLNEAGEMFQMPIAWYTQESKWAMAPGYDGPYHDDFSRPVTRACMFCHNAYPEVPTGNDRFGHPDRFPHDLPEGIGCERCHGPGADHVRVASDDRSTLKQVRESIVNPGRLDPKLRTDTCMQCHLQPTSKLTSFVRRFGRDDYSYVPGEPLEEYLVHIDFETVPPSEDRFEIDSAAYRMMRSACFTASEGALTCLTCHDPHRRVPEAEKMSWYRDACFECHSADACSVEHMGAAGERGIGADNCVACHMPKRRTEDVIHVVMTDHKIQRTPPEDPLAPLVESPSPLQAEPHFLMPDRAPGGKEGEMLLALPGVRDRDPRAIDRLKRAMKGVEDPPIEMLFERGTVELAVGQPEEAIGTFDRVVSKNGDLPLAHLNKAVALSQLRRYDDAFAVFEKSLALDPLSPDAHFNFALTLARAGKSEEAREHYEEAIRLRPTHAKAWFNLGNHLVRTRLEAYVGRLLALGLDPDAEAVSVEDSSAMEKAYEKATAIQPELGDAYVYLGALYAARHQYAEAIESWRRGMMRLPHDGRFMHATAAVRLAAVDRDFRDATTALNNAVRAARTDQSDAEFAFTVACALLANERYSEALAVAHKARELGAERVGCALLTAVAMHHANIAGARAFYDRAMQAEERAGRHPLHAHLNESARAIFAPAQLPSP